MGHFSSYRVYSRSCDLSLKCEKWLIFFVFSADTSKKSVTFLTKYLRASERSYLALSENADCWVLSYHYQDINL